MAEVHRSPLFTSISLPLFSPASGHPGGVVSIVSSRSHVGERKTPVRDLPSRKGQISIPPVLTSPKITNASQYHKKGSSITHAISTTIYVITGSEEKQ
jgi:hypothetical protein